MSEDGAVFIGQRGTRAFLINKAQARPAPQDSLGSAGFGSRKKIEMRSLKTSEKEPTLVKN